MVSTYRREAWHARGDGTVVKIGRVPKQIPVDTDPIFILATGQQFVDGTGHEPKFYLEGGMPADAGPFAPTMASANDPGVAGIRPQVARQNYSGTIDWSTPKVVKNANLTGNAAISLRNVVGPDHTISNCFCPGLDTPTVNPSTGGIIDCRASTVARLRVEFTTISPTYPNDRWDGVYGHDFTLYRSLIQHTVDGVATVNQYSPNVNVSVQGSWMGNLSWYNDDRGAHADGTHDDITQRHTGLYAEYLGNTVWAYKWNALNPTNGTPGPGQHQLSRTTGVNNLHPQAGQGILIQTEAYFHVGETVIDGLFMYGGDTPIKAGSQCKVSGHNHRWDNNPTIRNVRFMNDDQRDYGGSFHFYPIRTDNAESINGYKNWATTGINQPDPAWNWRWANSSSANPLYNVDPSRRGQPLFIRADAVV